MAGEIGVFIIGVLGDLLLIWAILATIGIAFMFWKLPGLLYSIIDQLLTDRGFPKTRKSGTGRPQEGLGAQIVGAVTERFLAPPQEGSQSLPSAPYRPGR